MNVQTPKSERAPRLAWKRKHDSHTQHAEEWTVVVGPYELRVWRRRDAAAFCRSVYLRGPIEGEWIFDRHLNGIAPRDARAAMTDMERHIEDQIAAMQLQLAGALRFETSVGFVK